MTRPARVDGIRPVTPAEVSEIWRSGWALLPRLVTPERTALLRDRARRLVSGVTTPRPGVDEPMDVRFAGGSNAVLVPPYRFASADDPALRAFVTSPTLGAGVAGVLGCRPPVRLFADSIGLSPGHASLGDGEAAPPLLLQQDIAGKPIDMDLACLYLALEPIQGDQGGLRFLDRSHLAGLVGVGSLTMAEVARRPRLAGLTLTPPPTLAADDALVYLSTVVCGSAPNTSHRDRLAYVCSFFPSDARFTGIPSLYTDGLGLRPFASLDHPRFPLTRAADTAD